MGVGFVVVGSDPFVEQGADEAFGFAVCLGASDAGVAGCDVGVSAAFFPSALEAFAVVGQDLFDGDAVVFVEGLAVVEEVEGVGGCFGGVEGGVCEPCSVVDADEQVVPAGFAFAAVGQACVGVARSLDAAEPFDVDVDQLAGPLPFVADHRFTHGWVEAGDAVAAQDRVHRRDRYAELPADRVRPRPELPAGLEDRPLKPNRGPSR